MRAFSLLAFDLDDTLYPEVEFVKSGFEAVAKHLDKLALISAELFFQTAWNFFARGIRGKIFNLALDQLSMTFSEDQLLELVSIYREHQPNIRPFPDSANLLQALKEQNCDLALISDGPFQTQLNKVRALGLERYFDYLLLTGAFGPDWGKPSPRAFLELMKRTGIEASKCVYVADNPRKDFLGPNRLGWHTIRVREKIGLYYHEIPPAGGEPRETLERLTDLWIRFFPQPINNRSHESSR
jgi:putative hydrolase of the HAD superfamily